MSEQSADVQADGENASASLNQSNQQSSEQNIDVQADGENASVEMDQQSTQDASVFIAGEEPEEEEEPTPESEEPTNNLC